MEEYKCSDCGAPMNEGEAKTFTCCEACWDKKYPPDNSNRVDKPVGLNFCVYTAEFNGTGEYLYNPKISEVFNTYKIIPKDGERLDYYNDKEQTQWSVYVRYEIQGNRMNINIFLDEY